MNKNIELLMPAGDMQKLKYAFAYGADAVYIGGKDFSLRARANNFTDEQICDAAEYAHSLGKKLYVTVNAFVRTEEEVRLREYLVKLQDAKVDALIVSDPGVVRLIKEVVPDMEIHLSTQMNTTNDSACKFWFEQGIKRIVLARELSIEEIKTITKNNPDLEFEIFIHGAMCISYSGRCFLSAYMIDRDANRGDCAHPCRWKYKVLEEGKRPGKFMPYEEDEKGSYIFNVNDMCLIDKIAELVDSGVSSFKIEGRMKSLYYITVVTKLYREAIDLYLKSPEEYILKMDYFLDEINKLNNRGYTQGFYFGEPEAKDYNYNGEFDKITHYFLAEVLCTANSSQALPEQCLSNNKVKVLIKNNIFVGDKVEILTPGVIGKKNVATIKSIYSIKDEEYIEKGYCDLEAIVELDNFSSDAQIVMNEFSIIRINKEV